MTPVGILWAGWHCLAAPIPCEGGRAPGQTNKHQQAASTPLLIDWHRRAQRARRANLELQASLTRAIGTWPFLTHLGYGYLACLSPNYPKLPIAACQLVACSFPATNYSSAPTTIHLHDDNTDLPCPVGLTSQTLPNSTCICSLPPIFSHPLACSFISGTFAPFHQLRLITSIIIDPLRYRL